MARIKVMAMVGHLDHISSKAMVVATIPTTLLRARAMVNSSMSSMARGLVLTPRDRVNIPHLRTTHISRLLSKATALLLKATTSRDMIPTVVLLPTHLLSNREATMIPTTNMELPNSKAIMTHSKDMVLSSMVSLAPQGVLQRASAV